jgi:Protein of unknown function (DUF2726)
MEYVSVRPRKSIFDSGAEKDLFRELESRWTQKLRLFAQTPLRNLLEISPAEVIRMKERHKRYFRSASVDFTFTNLAGRPLLSIEFDGIGGGFGHGRRYVQARPTPDSNREWKMNFKLRATARAGYPLFVVSSEETESLAEEDSITIVDGIVGQLLSREEGRILLREMLLEDGDQLLRLSRSEAHEHIQDLLLQSEVLSDLEHDPLAKAIAKEGSELFERYGLGTGEAQYPWLCDPPAPDTDGFPPSPEILEARISAYRNASRVGAKVGVPTGIGTDRRDYIHATVWMRNLGQEHGLVPELIAEQIAHLCALRKLRAAAERGEIADLAGWV